MYWNADQGDIRIIQKDGKILLADTQFNTDEYEKVKNFGKTLPQLKLQRIEERKNLNSKVFDNYLNKEQEKVEYILEKCNINPVKFDNTYKKTITEVKDNRKLQHRAKAGLSPEPYDEKSIK